LVCQFREGRITGGDGFFPLGGAVHDGYGEGLRNDKPAVMGNDFSHAPANGTKQTLQPQ